MASLFDGIGQKVQTTGFQATGTGDIVDQSVDTTTGKALANVGGLVQGAAELGAGIAEQNLADDITEGLESTRGNVFVPPAVEGETAEAVTAASSASAKIERAQKGGGRSGTWGLIRKQQKMDELIRQYPSKANEIRRSFGDPQQKLLDLEIWNEKENIKAAQRDEDDLLSYADGKGLNKFSNGVIDKELTIAAAYDDKARVAADANYQRSMGRMIDGNGNNVMNPRMKRALQDQVQRDVGSLQGRVQDMWALKQQVLNTPQDQDLIDRFATSLTQLRLDIQGIGTQRATQKFTTGGKERFFSSGDASDVTGMYKDYQEGLMKTLDELGETKNLTADMFNRRKEKFKNSLPDDIIKDAAVSDILSPELAALVLGPDILQSVESVRAWRKDMGSTTAKPFTTETATTNIRLVTEAIKGGNANLIPVDVANKNVSGILDNLEEFNGDDDVEAASNSFIGTASQIAEGGSAEQKQGAMSVVNQNARRKVQDLMGNVPFGTEIVAVKGADGKVVLTLDTGEQQLPPAALRWFRKKMKRTEGVLNQANEFSSTLGTPEVMLDAHMMDVTDALNIASTQGDSDVDAAVDDLLRSIMDVPVIESPQARFDVIGKNEAELASQTPEFEDDTEVVTPPSKTTDVKLIDALIQIESAGDPDAVSPVGAKGLMQIMPATAKNAGFGMEPLDLDTATPAQQREWGTRYLGKLKTRYGGNTTYALAAYNWGLGNVDKWVRAGADEGKLPKETRDYLNKFRKAGAL